MDGDGRGIPFAFYVPDCGGWYPVYRFGGGNIVHIIDLAAFCVNAIFYAMIAWLAKRVSSRLVS
jgi:hypothetical protein